MVKQEERREALPEPGERVERPIGQLSQYGNALDKIPQLIHECVDLRLDGEEYLPGEEIVGDFPVAQPQLFQAVEGLLTPRLARAPCEGKEGIRHPGTRRSHDKRAADEVPPDDRRHVPHRV